MQKPDINEIVERAKKDVANGCIKAFYVKNGQVYFEDEFGDSGPYWNDSALVGSGFKSQREIEYEIELTI